MRSLVITAAICAACLTACQSEENLKSLSLDPDKLELDSKGQTETIKANAVASTGAPAPASTAEWKSSDPSVVTVDGGKVTAVKSGEATITATLGKLSAQTKVTVSIPGAIELSPNPVTINGVGREVNLTAVLKDDNGRPIPGAVVLWRTNNKGVATVEDGKVTAVAAGSAILSALHADVKATVPVEVKELVFAKLAMKPPKLALKQGDTKPVSAMAVDGKGKPVEDVPFEWASSDESVAKVGEDGTVTAVGKGKAKITATASKKSTSCDVVVK